MRYVVEAGTDAASLLLFDPQTLPEEFEAANRNGDPTEMLNDLHDQGRLFWINTDGDGGYLLHAFINEEPPELIRPYLRDPKTAEHFEVASGRIFFVGAEYGFRDDDSGLKRYPGMGGSFPAEIGTYRITLYRTEYPDGLHEMRFRQRSTRVQRFAHGTIGALAAFAVVLIVATIIGLFAMSWATWLKYFLPVTMLAVILPIVLSHLRVFRSANALWREVNGELPSIVAILDRKALTPASSPAL